jgi:hypothetical protein
MFSPSCRSSRQRIHARPFLEPLEDRTVFSTSLPLNSSLWTALGPASLTDGATLYSGRIAAVAGDPTNVNVIYVAAAGGGVWKTINAGASWSPLTDTQASLFMGAIAVAPSNPNIVYAGTGEPNLGPSKLALHRDNIYYGRGILKSVDGGAHWTLTGLPVFNRRTISKIVVDPSDPNTVYATVGAVATNGLPGNTGVWKSVDGGATWADTTAAISTTAAFSDLVMSSASDQVLYAAIGDPAGNAANGIYVTSNAGASWARLQSFPFGATDPHVGRITLAISQNSPQVLYASIAASSSAGAALGTLHALEVTTDGGVDWANLPNTPNYMGGFGDYNTTLAIDPSNPAIVYAGGQDSLIRTMDGGNSWQDIGAIHPDHHGIGFDAGGRLLDANDGGLWRLDNPSLVQWTDLNNNLNITQFVGVALNPTTADIAYAGAQDNGTDKFHDSLQWQIAQGGDGGFVRVDPGNPNTVYHTFYYSGDGFLERSDDGGASWAPKTAGINTSDPANFYPPYIVDPYLPIRLLLGTNRVYESLNRADSWAPISTPGIAGWGTAALIDSVAVSSNENIVYASAGGHILITYNHGASWIASDPVPAPPANLRFKAIAVDPTNPLIAYVTAANFGDSTGGGHVWRTADGGQTWKNISGNFPDLPAWSMALNHRGVGSDVIYVGTDSEVFYSANLGASWAPFGAALPNVQVTDLEFNENLGVLAAATHGRGVWEIAASSGLGSITATGADAGGGPDVRVFDAVSGALRLEFYAYDPRFLGGVRVAVADVTNDGVPDIITAPGPGGSPDIRIFDSRTGALIREFMAYAPQFSGGVYVAAGDLTGHGYADVITGADAGGGPEIKAFDIAKGQQLADFYGLAPSFNGGVRVAAGDVNGDGRADIIAGAGPGGAPLVNVFSGFNGALLRSFNAYNLAFRGGVYVAAGDVDGDGRADIVTGAGPGGGPHVEVFSGASGAIIQSFMAYAKTFAGGVRVAAADINGDGHADLITGPGTGSGPQVIVWEGTNLQVLESYFAYSALFTRGIFVSAPLLGTNSRPRLLVTAAGPGGGPEVRVVDPLTGALRLAFYAYAPVFTGGVRVAVGDVTGDGVPDIVTAPGPGGGPDIRVFDSRTGALEREFYAYSPLFTGGVFVAVGDVNGDGIGDIVTGADAGGTPEVKVFSGATGAQLVDFLPFPATFTGGVRVAVGDVNGDGRADIITAAGPGGTPLVEVFSGVDGSLIRSFYAFVPNFTGGVYIAAGDTNGDGTADIITGAGAGGTPFVQVFSGGTGVVLQSFMAFDVHFTGGVRVAAVDANGDGRADIVTAAGPGGEPDVIVRDGLSQAVLDSFFAFAPAFSGGVFVGGH